jgi:hypothetical protein
LPLPCESDTEDICFLQKKIDITQLNIPLRRIQTIINPQMEKPITYNAYQYYVRQDTEVLELWQAQRQK